MDEDLILKQLFADYFEALGAAYEAEAERLNNDPSFVFPEPLHQRCLEFIDREMSNRKKARK